MYSFKAQDSRWKTPFVRLSQSEPRRSGHYGALGTVLTLRVATLVKSSRADPRLILCSPHDLFNHLMGSLDPRARALERVSWGLCSAQNRLQPQSSHSVFGSVAQHCRREHIHHPHVGVLRCARLSFDTCVNKDEALCAPIHL